MLITPPHGTPARPSPASPPASPSGRPTRRLVIVVRADPVICGHSGEARHLAEAALQRGFDDVRIVTWPLDSLAALPLKPLDSVAPYSPGISVERPEPVGDYKVPDGRAVAGLTGRLVELFCEDVPTVAMSLYLTPHADIVVQARSVARSLGRARYVTTVAEAVGSDITNVVRSCVETHRFGAAAQALTTYLANDCCVAVSEFTKRCIVAAAHEVDAALGTNFAEGCDARVGISYPAVDASHAVPSADEVAAALVRRGLEREGYVLFLSRLSPEKGADDAIDGFERSAVSDALRLVVAGTGPSAAELRDRAAQSSVSNRIDFLDDVDDVEKRSLMAGCAAFVLPSRPTGSFVETFGIALVEKMLAGGGPIITTATGGIPEAVGPHATIVPVDAPGAIAAALDDAVLSVSRSEQQARASAARVHAEQFDRLAVLDRLMDRVRDVDAAALPVDGADSRLLPTT